MIQIDIIPHEEQRYNTVGDYYERDGQVYFKISHMGNYNYELLILIHELLERHVCQLQDISDEDIDNWDMAHLDDPEPGSLPGCPYGVAHWAADHVERIVAQVLGVSWDDYSSACDKQIGRS